MRHDGISRDTLVIAALAFGFGMLLCWAIIDPPMAAISTRPATQPSEWPAWVQAVGSVLAIAVAVLVPAQAAARQRQEEAMRRQSRVQRAATLLHQPLIRLTRLLYNFAEANSLNDDPDLDFHAMESDFEKITPQLLAVVNANPDLDELGPDLFKLINHLSAYEHWLNGIADIMAAGYNNHMMRTEMPTRVARVLHMYAIAERLLIKIDARVPIDDAFYEVE